MMTRLKQLDQWLLSAPEMPEDQITAALREITTDLRTLRWNTHRAVQKRQMSLDEGQAVLRAELDQILDCRNARLADVQRTLRLYLTQKKVSRTTMTKVEALGGTSAHFEEQGRLEMEYGLITP